MVVFLVVLLVVGEVRASVKCYSCDSSTNKLCATNSLVSIVTVSHADGCTCCRTHIDDTATKRDCVQSLNTVIDCAPTPYNTPCFSDYCNAATHSTVTTTLGSLITLVTALVIRHFY